MSTSDLAERMKGKIAFPRKNGELTFESPWEGRIFAMAVLLFEKGHYDWELFSEQLIKEIGKAESDSADHDVALSYYNHWLAAFERLLLDRGICTRQQLEPIEEEDQRST